MKDNPPAEVEDGGKAIRKRWMATKENRQAITIPKDVVVGMEFCNGYLGEFS